MFDGDNYVINGFPSSIIENDEKVLITATDRGTNESYVGISYIELKSK